MYRGDVMQNSDRPDEAVAAYDAALHAAPATPAPSDNRAAALLTFRPPRWRWASRSRRPFAPIPARRQAWNNRGNLNDGDSSAGWPPSPLEGGGAARGLISKRSSAARWRKSSSADFDEGSGRPRRRAACSRPASPTMRAQQQGDLLLQRGDFEQRLGARRIRARILSRMPKRALKLPGRMEGSARWQEHRGFDEQGFGDAIDSCAFASNSTGRGGRGRSSSPQARPAPAFSSSAIRLAEHVIVPGALHHQIALCSLPRALRIRADTIPSRTPYLGPEPALAAKWADAARIARLLIKVGVCWRGSANLKADPGRALPRAAFERLQWMGCDFQPAKAATICLRAIARRRHGWSKWARISTQAPTLSWIRRR